MIGLDELRTLDAAAFNRAIAKAAGWTNLHAQSHWIEDWHDTYEDTRDFGSHLEHSEPVPIPRFASELNAAWALCVGVAVIVEKLDGPDEETIASLSDHVAKLATSEQHASPARALATAWYVLKITPPADAPDL